MAAVELTQGYVSLALAFEGNPGEQLGKTFEGFKKQADQTGKEMSSALAAGMEGGAARIQAEMAKARRDMESTARAAQAARDKEEAATRKVEIAEAKLQEARASGKSSASQLLVLEDRLASAKTTARKASMESTAAERKAADAKEEARDAAVREAKALNDLGKAADQAGEKAQGFGKKFANGLKTKLTTNPFKTLSGQAGASGDDAGKKFGSEFTGKIKASVSKLDMKSVLAGAAGGLATVVGGNILSTVSGGIGGAMEQVDSNQTFAKSLEFAKVNKQQIAQLSAQSQDYANKTVYDLAEIRDTTASFASSGVKDAQGFTEALGNLNAVGGGTSETFSSVTMASAQIAGAGKLTTENWNQMRDAIPGAAAVVQKELQKSGAYTGNFNDAMSKGQITAEEYQKAIMKVGTTDVAKQAASSATTFSGAWGNMQATVEGGLAKTLTAIQPFVTGAMNAMAPLIERGFAVVARQVGDLAGLIQRHKPQIMATLTQVKDFILNQVIPAVKSFADLVIGMVDFVVRHRDVFAPIAVGVLAMVGAFKAYQGVMAVARGAAMAFRGAQMAVNIVMAANPIGIVVLALVGLAAGFVYAYKQSETFRRVVNNAWSSVKNGASAFWTFTRDKVLAPMGRFFTKTIPDAAKAMGRGITDVWNDTKRVSGAVVGWFWTNVVMRYVNFFTKTIPNAGRAMGRAISGMWDGILTKSSSVWGSMKKHVLNPFNDFFTKTIPDAAGKARDGFSTAWDGIKHKASEPVKAIIDTVWNDGIVSLASTAGLGDVFKKVPFQGFRSGGLIPGRWSAAHRDPLLGVTGSGIPHVRVEPEEYVVKRSSTMRSMGLLDAINAGQIDDRIWDAIPGHANGGVVGGSGTWTPKFLSEMLAAANSLGRTLNIAQRGFRPATSYSGTSHRGDAVDVMGPGNLWDIRDALRQVGIASWVRGPRQGFSWHVHGVPMSSAYGSGAGSAIYQAMDYAAGGAGLRGMGQADPYGGRGSQTGPSGGVLGTIGGVFQSAWDKISGPFEKLKSKAIEGSEPWLGSVMGFKDKLLSAAKEKLMSVGGAIKGAASDAVDTAKGAASKAAVRAVAATFSDSWRDVGGWSNGDQWSAIDWIVSRESGWDPNAKNPNSTARGLFQLLYEPGTRTPYGPHNVAQQARDGLGYIKGRYKTPQAAKAFWQSHNWYDAGGYLQPGSTAVMNGTGSPEPVFTSKQWQSVDRLAAAGAMTLDSALSQKHSVASGQPIIVAITGELDISEDGVAYIEGVAQDVFEAAESASMRRSYP